MRSEPANQWNAENAVFPDIYARKALRSTVADAPTTVDIDTLKRTGVELGWIPEVHHERLVDQHQVE